MESVIPGNYNCVECKYTKHKSLFVCKKCSANTGRKHYAKGLCHEHYMQEYLKMWGERIRMLKQIEGYLEPKPKKKKQRAKKPAGPLYSGWQYRASLGV